MADHHTTDLKEAESIQHLAQDVIKSGSTEAKDKLRREVQSIADQGPEHTAKIFQIAGKLSGYNLPDVWISDDAKLLQYSANFTQTYFPGKGQASNRTIKITANDGKALVVVSKDPFKTF